ncbi:MAG TPA: TonB-dependent receptor [Thermoanaerobaculia bacterium]|nr:TonB-dependent receptor [Thermoanaerobaculia bacterium]
MSSVLDLRRFLALVTVALLVAAVPVLAQNPSGTLTGTVQDDSGGSLPGVTVTATSPQLQGARTAQTDVNGNYKLAFLPPGTYTVTYELDGFATATREVKLSAAQTTDSDIVLQIAALAEEIVVTGQQAEISESVQGAATYTQDEVEKLPVTRDLLSTINLAPGVADTGPSTAPSISGAVSYENLWLVNGVVINENIRGSVLPLFIEDAIQETTTAVSGISAEYGRFTGGVVNAITKSGGNEFDGSVRVSMTNDDWIARTPQSPERLDDINQIYEATLGGYLWKDHVWFFGAGRDRELTSSQSTFVTNIPFEQANEETRLEGKLTVSPTANHTLIGSYLEIDQVTTNSGFGQFLDLDSLSDREDPQEIKSGNYTGILTPNFFVEAQYSERDWGVANGSGGVPDLIEGTLWRSRTEAWRFHAPTFCGSCEDEIRNNENLLGKVSYFLSTEDLGSHDLVFGYDTFEDIRFAINHQTGSDFTTYASGVLFDADGTPYPQVGSNAWIRWFIVLNQDLATPTSFKTNSYYLNDRWQLNDRWSFNLGLRYDENEGANSAGRLVADDAKLSPRLGASWDVNGDGDLVVNASYGTYVAAINNAVGDTTSNGGAIGSFIWTYGGPPINTDPSCIDTGTCVSSADALRIMFDWYLSQGGTTDSVFNIDPDAPINAFNIAADIPGETSTIPDTLLSPSADEFTLGATKRIGTRGLVRADVVFREFDDFYSNRVTLATGPVDTPAGPTDLTEVGNFGGSVLEREYRGLHTQARYRFTDRLSAQINYTLSQTEGNVDGETDVSGAVSTDPFAYPEYQEARWAFPSGDLSTDQRHKFRGWLIYDLFNTDHHNLSVSLLQNFYSGTPYGAVGVVDTREFVTNPGYQQPPSTVTYWFTERDAFRTDDITRTDLSLNYSFLFNAFGRGLEVYLQPEVINLFNEQGVVDVNTGISDPTTGREEFNPFTETPVEGVHWAKGARFGQPVNQDDYQTPRTFRFSVGFRF